MRPNCQIIGTHTLKVRCVCVPMKTSHQSFPIRKYPVCVNLGAAEGYSEVSLKILTRPSPLTGVQDVASGAKCIHLVFWYRAGASAATSAVMSRAMFLALQGANHPTSYP